MHLKFTLLFLITDIHVHTNMHQHSKGMSKIFFLKINHTVLP